MILFDGYRPKTKTMNFILMDGGVGDHVGALVALDYVIRKHPWITPLIWVQDYFKDFARHCLRHHDVIIRSYSEMRHGYNPNYPTKTTKWDGIVSPMKIHTVDYAFLKIADDLPPTTADKEMPQIDPSVISLTHTLPDKFVVVTTAFTADVREFPPAEVNKVTRYLIDRGVTPVFLGKEETKTGARHVIKGTVRAEEIDFDGCLNLLDKTTLLEAAKIMSLSKAVIGVDNGLLHVAACTQVPIIAGFTTVKPSIRTPVRNGMSGYEFYPVEPSEKLNCRFCQCDTGFLFGHDYRDCLFKGIDEPRTNLCTKQMTAEKFIIRLDTVL